MIASSHNRSMPLRYALALLCAAPLAAQFAGWPPLPQDAAEALARGDAQGMQQKLHASAEAGDSSAMFWLGRTYEEVRGATRDYALAREWYGKAAERRVGVAAWSLGRLLEMGRGVAIDVDEARRWYAKAADLDFRRTALTVVKLRWRPGGDVLEYEPVPESLRTPPPPASPELAFLSRPAEDVTKDELDTLRKAGLTGRMSWSGSEPGLFGLPARLILVARGPVVEEARLPVPIEGVAIYVQMEGEWRRYGEGKLGARVARIAPQSPGSSTVMVAIELEGGGEASTGGWDWGREAH
jgi:hypothetical protein